MKAIPAMKRPTIRIISAGNRRFLMRPSLSSDTAIPSPHAVPLPVIRKDTDRSQVNTSRLAERSTYWLNNSAMWNSPITLRRPVRQAAGIVLTSPHSGHNYPRAFLEASKLNETSIRSSEDAFVDDLFGLAPALGLPLLAAEFPRAWCDANREPWELDPSMFADKLPDYVNSASPRVAAGLGTVARIVGAGKPIYARKLYFHEAEQRIKQCWRPFHAALAGLIAECRSQFGYCLILDCHSMPSPVGRQDRQTDIILGDGHGTTCAPALSAFIEANLSARGFTVSRNSPYAGGFITRYYGRPDEAVQTIQIEIARGLYMDERQMARKPTFAAMRERLGQFIQDLANAGPIQGVSAPCFIEAAE